MPQEGDVLLFQTDDDGDIEVINGIVTMSGGLETAAYISLFGGNKRDDGRPDNQFNWWGNLSENEIPKHIRSETQNLLAGLPATSFNLLRVEDAVLRDLQWMIDVKAANIITAVATIPGLNKIAIAIQIQAVGQESEFTFTANWKATV